MNNLRHWIRLVEEAEKQTEAFQKGYSARLRNPEEATPNPYPEGTTEHADYAEGWLLADQDYELLANMVRPEPIKRTFH